MVASGCSYVSVWETEGAVRCAKNKIMSMSACASMHEGSVCCTVRQSECRFHRLSAWMCMRVCAHVHPYDGGRWGGGLRELGLSMRDQHRSDWEDPVLLSRPHM